MFFRLQPKSTDCDMDLCFSYHPFWNRIEQKLYSFKGLFMDFKTAGWTAVSLSQNKLKSMLLSDLDARTVWCINCLIAFWWIYGNHKWCGNIACTYQILTAEMNTHTFRNNGGIEPALPKFFPNCQKTLNNKNQSNLIGWNIRKAANSLGFRFWAIALVCSF